MTASKAYGSTPEASELVADEFRHSSVMDLDRPEPDGSVSSPFVPAPPATDESIGPAQLSLDRLPSPPSTEGRVHDAATDR
jgi:hypothetical protein